MANLQDMLKGLQYLVNWRKSHKERLVVNISMSMTHVPQILNCINELVELDVPVCVAACNDGGEKSAAAEYDAPIVVGNLETPTRLHETSSCWGEDTDCAVLGTDIYSCSRTKGYRLLTGTSMASPAVAGMMALILSRWPDLSEQKAYEYLMSLCGTAVKCNSGHHKIPVPAFKDDFKEVIKMREVSKITGITPGKQLVVYDAEKFKTKVGNLREGDFVIPLAESGEKVLVIKGKELEQVCGWINKKYLKQ